MVKLRSCFRKKNMLFMAVFVALAVGVGFGLHWWSERPGPNTPPYSVSFYCEYDHSAWASPETIAYQENEPIIVKGYAGKFHSHAPAPNMYGGWGKGYIHPITLIVKDPDGLVYKWQNELSHGEYVEQARLWQSKVRGIHFDFDLQDWVPEGFKWKMGYYMVRGIFSVERRRMEIGGGGFFMKEVPAAFRNLPPGTNPATLFKPMLSAQVEADKASYNTGDIITIRGYLKNISGEPFMVQTRYPFRRRTVGWGLGRDVYPLSPGCDHDVALRR